MYAFGLWWLRNDALERSGFDKVGFSAVPFCKDLVRRGAAKNARVNQASEADARNVS